MQETLKMQIKEVAEITIFYHQLEASIKELEHIYQTISPKMLEDINKTGLELSSPPFWQYTGLDGNPDTRFQLEMSFPVKEIKDYQGEFRFKKTEKFRCAMLMHYGPYDNLMETYEELFSQMKESGLTPSGGCREVYHQIDGLESSFVIEVQVGYA